MAARVRTIDPSHYKSSMQMMLEICEGCMFNVRANNMKEYNENSKHCYPCYDDMEKKFDEGKPFEIEW